MAKASSKSGSSSGKTGNDGGKINVCLVGQKFMGRTHSNAFLKVDKFFDVPVHPVMHTIVGRAEGNCARFRSAGVAECVDGLEAAVTSDEIGLVDIGTPNHLHAEMSIAALEAGNMSRARSRWRGRWPMRGRCGMRRRRRGEEAADVRLVQLSPRAGGGAGASVGQGGKLGGSITSGAFYLQDWGGPGVPLLWRFQKKFAGSGRTGI
jgi:hypothetical protein